MALSADRQAMLQLLLERGQSYEDIAGVLGVGVDEVRTRARAALAELGGADPDAEVGLTDYLLGQADPIGRADVVRHLQSDPDSRRLATELLERLGELAPGAELPQLPKQREPGRRLGRRQRHVAEEAGREARPPPEAGRDGLRTSLSRRQQQAIVAALASAVLLLVGVLAIAGVFGGGEAESTADTEAPADEGEVIESVSLQPQGGADASGEATFGLATGDQPFVEVDISGLEPPSQDRTYVIWLLLTQDQGYPLSPIQVSEDGGFSDRFPIPQFAIPIASRARFVDISLSENRTLLRDLRQAVERQAPVLGYEGESVLRGRIPASARGRGGDEGGG